MILYSFGDKEMIVFSAANDKVVGVMEKALDDDGDPLFTIFLMNDSLRKELKGIKSQKVRTK